MYFNELMSISDIISAYRNNTFPNAYCLVTASLDNIDILSTEDTRLIETQNRKLVRKDGNTNIIIH